MKWNLFHRALRGLPGAIALLLLLVVITPATSALTPGEIAAVAAAIAEDDPEAMILEVHLESSRSGGIVSVETSHNTEYYVGLASSEILERERGGRGNARIADRIAENSDTMDLYSAYAAVLDYLATHDRYSRISEGDFSSIEYKIEFGRLIVEVVFESPAGELNVYMDPVTGEILEPEWYE
jgi:hypothetical protein